jgi:hypothetical protein
VRLRGRCCYRGELPAGEAGSDALPELPVPVGDAGSAALPELPVPDAPTSDDEPGDAPSSFGSPDAGSLPASIATATSWPSAWL